MGKMREYSLAEVKRHNLKNDMWFVHEGKVVDITPFVAKHPGGMDVLLEHSGDDVTAVMRSSPHEHTPFAYNILNKYVIGTVEGQSTKNGNGVHHAHEETNGFYDWSEDKLIDWSKPIFWQVGQLGDKYMEWCHQPIDREIRLFYSDFCEFFSKTQWWIIPSLWLPIITIMTWLSYESFNSESWEFLDRFHVKGVPLSSSAMPYLFLSGSLFWSFLEYSVHRWLFHMTPPAGSPLLITTHFILHGQHHKAPFDRLRLVFPPVPAMGFFIAFFIVYIILFPKPIALCLLAGTAFGYVCYDLTHYYLHHGGVPFLKYFQNLKQYHNAHHFEHQMKGFGISSKLWDYPFQTLIPERNKKNS